MFVFSEDSNSFTRTSRVTISTEILESWADKTERCKWNGWRKEVSKYATPLIDCRGVHLCYLDVQCLNMGNFVHVLWCFSVDKTSVGRIKGNGSLLTISFPILCRIVNIIHTGMAKSIIHTVFTTHRWCHFQARFGSWDVTSAIIVLCFFAWLIFFIVLNIIIL